MRRSRLILLLAISSLIVVSGLMLGVKYILEEKEPFNAVSIESFVLDTGEVGRKAVEYGPLIGFELRYVDIREAELMPIEESPMPTEKITEDSPEKVLLCKGSCDALPIGEETWLRSYKLTIIIDESVIADEEVLILHMDLGDLKTIP